jgi:hypothetical protein
VIAALAKTGAVTRLHVPQIVELLAWDDVLPMARATLERLAPGQIGLFIDTMLDPTTDFVIRRRLPRVIATFPSPRSLEGLLDGLDDQRFEVRYHCSRGIDRILAANPSLSVDRSRTIAVVERELSVAPQRWAGYRVLDRPDTDEPARVTLPAEDTSRFLEYILRLLSTIVAREPLEAAVQAVRSPIPGVRALALEYLDQVLPTAVLERLRQLIAATRFGADGRAQSAVPPTTTPASGQH